MAEERQSLAVTGANKNTTTLKTVEYFQESLQFESKSFNKLNSQVAEDFSKKKDAP